MKIVSCSLAVVGALFTAQAYSQTDLTSLTASEAAAKIRAGEITSEALTRAFIERARAHQDLHAFITLNEDGALEAARAADAAAKRKKWMGPLHGVPIVLKDNIHVAGLPNSAGTPALKDFVPTQDAPVARRLRRAGAIVLGKTNMHELAFGITSNNAAFGAVENPYDTTRIAGGSSGGNGSAIAARLAPAGLGTDTGGSVRIPASLDGIMALRPTVGRYPQAGITPISHTRDTAGPMARSVEDLVLLDAVVTGTKANLIPARLLRLRLGVPRAMYADIDPETARVIEGVLARLKAEGVVLIEADVPNLADLNNKVSFPVALYEVTQDLPAYLKRYHTGVDFQTLAEKTASPDVHGLFAALLKGEPPSVPKNVYRDAIKKFRPQLRAAYARYFKQHKVEAILFPTTPLPAAPIGDDNDTELNGKRVPTFPTFIRNTDPGSNAGVPGLSMPAGLTPAGLPVGLELDGPAKSDRRLLAIGLALEKTLPPIPAPKI